MKKTLIYLCLIFTCISCGNDNGYNIPNVKFSHSINLDFPQYSFGSFIVRPKPGEIVGVNGVVIFKLNSDQYFAFDLMCTHNHENGVPYFVELEKNGDISLKCPNCGSKFWINSENGAIEEGPAPIPLKPYRTTLNGQILTIQNP